MRREENRSRLSMRSIATRTVCPLCAAWKEFQDALLEHPRPNDCRRFCNTHGWLVANSAPAEAAAAIFLSAITNPDWKLAAAGPEQCDFCRKPHEEAEVRLQEMVTNIRQGRLRSWLHDNGALCSGYGNDVISKLPEPPREGIQKGLARNGGEIAEILEDFLQRAQAGSHAGGGVFGRAAEFLAAQRGIERQEQC